MTSTSSCIGCTDYSWTVNGTAVPSADDQPNPCLDLLSIGAGTADMSVELTISTAAGCTSSSTQDVEVAQAPFLNLSGLPSFEQCNGAASFDLVVTELVGADMGDYSITWDVDDGGDVWTSDTPPNGETWAYPPGIYTLEYCVTGANGCMICDTYQVTNLPNPNMAFNVCEDAPVSGCAPFEVCLAVSGTSGNPTETNYFLDIGGSGTIDITSDIQDCTDTPCIINYTLPTSTCTGTGDASVTATMIAALPNGACVENEQSQVFEVAAPPAASITTDSEICLGQSTTVFNNSTPGTGLNTTGLTPGTYTFAYGGECLTTVEVSFEIYPLPNFSVLADPGATICAGDEVNLEALNLGGAAFDACQWIELPFTPIASGGSCSIDVFPVDATTSYQVQITDVNGCVGNGQTDISIQQQPFTLDCSVWAAGYCANTVETITFSDAVDAAPLDGVFTWYVNGVVAPAGSAYIPDLGPGSHDICYEFVHAQSPNCLFEGCCTVEVSALTMPLLSGETDVCQGIELLLMADAPAEFPGQWTFEDCPMACPLPADYSSDADLLLWNSVSADLGTYTLQYTGECLDTALHLVTLYSIPEVLWTPADITPCLNECFPLEITTLEGEDQSGWCLGGFDTCTALDSPFCPGEYSDGAAVDICLWATIDHPVPAGTLTCLVEDCHNLDPVESPGGYPIMPETACPATFIDLGINSALYDDCSFVLADYPPELDCGLAYIPTYGTFADTLFLVYDGCSDTLASTIYVPQPPSADLVLVYDECVGDATATLEDLLGDDLEFLWDVDYPLDDATAVAPVPNPIPYSDLTANIDATYQLEVTLFNACNSITLTDSVVFIATPDIAIDISEDVPFTGCTPEEVQFEIFLENTDNIDEVTWDFDVDYLDDLIFPNTVYPPLQEYLAFGVSDTVTVTAVATNQCGSDMAQVTFIIYPADVFVELPASLGSLCPGASTVLEPIAIGGDPWDVEVSISPENEGVLWDETTGTISVENGTPEGDYTITYTVYGCGDDSDNSVLEVLSSADLDFSWTDDGCAGETVAFTNLSSNASGYTWYFTNGSTSDQTNPTTVFTIPGIYDVTLEALSSDGCPTTYTQPVEITGPNVILSQLAPSACAGAYLSLSIPETNFLSLEWTIESEGNDPITYVASNTIEHLFEGLPNDLQVYTVTVTATDFNLCTATNSTQVFIAPSPNAYFTYSGNEQCATGATVQFTNGSSAGVQSLWEFGDGQLSTEPNPSHPYAESDNYTVNLQVVNAYGCEDSYSDILPCQDFDVFVPNAFTPDDDGTNDIFRPVIYGAEYLRFGEGEYRFYIADRWGDLIFYSENPTEGWLGDVHGGQHYAQNDVYIWHLEFTMPSGEPYNKTGHVTVVR